jgi:hypothetical protein
MSMFMSTPNDLLFRLVASSFGVTSTAYVQLNTTATERNVKNPNEKLHDKITSLLEFMEDGPDFSFVFKVKIVFRFKKTC